MKSVGSIAGRHRAVCMSGMKDKGDRMEAIPTGSLVLALLDDLERTEASEGKEA